MRDFEFARGEARGELKAAVCGRSRSRPSPRTTITSRSRTARSRWRTLDPAEIRGLGAAGATLVDVEEPALVAHPEHFALARAAIERLAEAGVPLALQAYFFPADSLLDALAAFPVAQVGIDVRSRDTRALDKLNAFRQTVVLGIVDARNTRVETESEFVALIELRSRGSPAEYLGSRQRRELNTYRTMSRCRSSRSWWRRLTRREG